MKIKIYTFNVNGIRAIGKKGFWEWLDSEKPDVLCIQEIKADDSVMRTLKSGHENINLQLLDNSIEDPLQNYSLIHSPKFLDGKSAALGNRDENLFDSNSVLHSDSAQTSNSSKLNYNLFWHSCSMKKGYSGTSIFYKPELFKQVEIWTGTGNPKFDVEGRLSGLKTEHFTLINCYYPQGGREGRVAYKLDFYKEIYNLVQKLESEGQKVILTGDFNTTLKDIDLARPKENRLTTGCLPEERVAMNWILDSSHFEPLQLQVVNSDFTYLNEAKTPSLDFIDAFRYLYPYQADKYTYWDQITRARERNVGWRIDYFNISSKLKSNLVQAEILDQVTGSDHCPVKIELEF